MSYRKLNIDENIILKNKIPLLIKDASWMKLFGNSRDRNIQRTKKELLELLDSKRNLEWKEAALQGEKQRAMEKILDISHQINEEEKVETIELLDRYKERIEEINGELEEIEFELEYMPKRLNESNFNLLKATVYVGYKELKSREKKLKDSTEELDGLRERLKDLIEEKYNNEEWIDSTYSFLHGILGNKEMEKLDERIF